MVLSRKRRSYCFRFCVGDGGGVVGDGRGPRAGLGAKRFDGLGGERNAGVDEAGGLGEDQDLARLLGLGGRLIGEGGHHLLDVLGLGGLVLRDWAAAGAGRLRSRPGQSGRDRGRQLILSRGRTPGSHLANSDLSSSRVTKPSLSWSAAMKRPAPAPPRPPRRVPARVLRLEGYECDRGQRDDSRSPISSVAFEYLERHSFSRAARNAAAVLRIFASEPNIVPICCPVEVQGGLRGWYNFHRGERALTRRGGKNRCRIAGSYFCSASS